jgi:hypothetical protein
MNWIERHVRIDFPSFTSAPCGGIQGRTNKWTIDKNCKREKKRETEKPREYNEINLKTRKGEKLCRCDKEEDRGTLCLLR